MGQGREENTLLEDLVDEAGFFIRPTRMIESGASEYQDYEVWESKRFGKLFRLDGYFMTSEKDEFFYHENLIHVPLMAHAAPERALVIGGGDGGSVEELFKYPTIRQVTLVELDAKVIEIARDHFASIHKGALDDERLELRIEDGLKYVREVAPQSGVRFDLIALDLTDPIGPAEALYTAQFFNDCKALLTEQGAMVLHIGAPFYHPERVSALVERLRTVFDKVAPYFVFVPLYGALWGMAVASDRLDPTELAAGDIDQRIEERGIANLQYYNGAMHQAQFALPNYLRELLR